jgi:hypothetical protein
MFFPKLSDDERGEIAKQIAELIDAFTSEGRLGDAPIPQGLELCESCREVILDLPGEWKDLIKQGARIEQWRRPQTAWYHQLRTASEEFGFARSIEVDGPAGRSHRVIEVVPSAVAHEFQNAVRFVDAEEPEAGPPGSEPSVFLLHVPRYAFYSLATAGAVDPEKEGSKITLVCPFFRERLPVAEWKQESLPALLDDLPDAFGASDPEPWWLYAFSALHRLLRTKSFR